MQFNTQPLRLLATASLLSLLTITLFVATRDSSATRKYVLKTPSKPQTQLQWQTCPSNEPWEFITARDADNHGLSEEQCRIAFPKLYFDIDESASERRNRSISFKEIDSVEVGEAVVRAGVFDGEVSYTRCPGLECDADHVGQLYIIDMGDMRYTHSRAQASLYSLHRALTSSPERRNLPNIEFVFSADDYVSDPSGAIWTYSKRESDRLTWLMPDFGYWAWPEVQIGPYSETRRRMASIDAALPFREKKKQLLWRGSLTPNPSIRAKLLKTAIDQPWASIRVLDWDDPTDVIYNRLPIEDHCRYMFLAHTEGRSFSGRGKYLFNCRSVVVSHQLEWREAHHGALVAGGPDANFVIVERDYADLGRKIKFLVDHPEVAERIAENAVRSLRDRYLTPAAESCYWRELMRLYASVCEFEPLLVGGDGKARGVPFESWVLGVR